MPAQQRNLSVLSYANGFTLWHYISTDKLNDILKPDYFNGQSDQLRTNDTIMVNAETGGTPQNTQLSVRSVSKGVVSVYETFSREVSPEQSVVVADANKLSETLAIEAVKDKINDFLKSVVEEHDLLKDHVMIPRAQHKELIDFLSCKTDTLPEHIPF